MHRSSSTSLGLFWRLQRCFFGRRSEPKKNDAMVSRRLTQLTLLSHCYRHGLKAKGAHWHWRCGRNANEDTCFFERSPPCCKKRLCRRLLSRPRASQCYLDLASCTSMHLRISHLLLLCSLPAGISPNIVAYSSILPFGTIHPIAQLYCGWMLLLRSIRYYSDHPSIMQARRAFAEDPRSGVARLRWDEVIIFRMIYLRNSSFDDSMT